MGPTWGATRRYWKQSPHQAVQQALRCSAQQRNSNEYWNDLQTVVSLLKEVQTQYCLGVSLGSFIRQAISIRESWMSEVCARGRPCNPPEHWARNLFIDPPSDEEFPAEVAENFVDGQPWHNAPDELSCGELWRALDENM